MKKNISIISGTIFASNRLSLSISFGNFPFAIDSEADIDDTFFFLPN